MEAQQVQLVEQPSYPGSDYVGEEDDGGAGEALNPLSPSFPSTMPIPQYETTFTRWVEDGRVDLSTLDLSNLFIRPYKICDLEDVEKLHAEWFPVKYPKSYFTSLGALLNTCCLVYSIGEEEAVVGLVAYTNRAMYVRPEEVMFLRGEGARTSRAMDTVRGLKEYRARHDNAYVDVAYILSVGVNRLLRNRGLARKLIQYCVDEFKSLKPDALAIYLNVVIYNDLARHVYERLGFEIMTRLRKYYSFNNRTYDAYLLGYFYPNTELPHPTKPWWMWWK